MTTFSLNELESNQEVQEYLLEEQSQKQRDMKSEVKPEIVEIPFWGLINID